VARRKSKSKDWLDRQHRDPFVKGSQKAGYRSRAVYKLSEIDQKDRLIMSGDTVLDLGAAPGGGRNMQRHEWVLRAESLR